MDDQMEDDMEIEFRLRDEAWRWTLNRETGFWEARYIKHGAPTRAPKADRRSPEQITEIITEMILAIEYEAKQIAAQK